MVKNEKNKKNEEYKRPLRASFITGLPHEAGIYMMKDGEGGVIYVGKARDLRRRLSSYLRYLGDKGTKTGVMLAHARHIETIVTATEKEALILEASLIKRHKPKYNIILRDDKNYPFIKVTVDEEWPRLLVVRRRRRDKARYFGPFSSASAMWETIRLLNRFFPLRRCKGRDLRPRKRACLNYQMRSCLAPCLGMTNREEYLAVVSNVLLILGGRNQELVKRLRHDMEEAAADLQFERAAGLRDQITALGKTMERQVIAAGHHRDEDVFALVRRNGAAALAVLLVRDGVLNGHHSYFIAQPGEDDAELLAEVIARFYAEHPVPSEILLPWQPAGSGVLREWLVEERRGAVVFKLPKRGDLKQLLIMAEKNAGRVFVEQDRVKDAWLNLGEETRKRLFLPRIPERITCMDISNIGGRQTVGAVVNFWQGEKEGTRYRHYKIERPDGRPDDYASMTEVMSRHLKRAAAEGYLPDLLLVDGGKGQLNAARTVLAALSLEREVELAGIAKEHHDEGEKIFRPGRKNPLKIAQNSPVLLLLMRIRDEAHRFGITFHRKWRLKEAMSSPLDAIAGVGKVRKEALLKSLGSLQRLKAASREELAAIPGIGPQLAHKLWLTLREDEQQEDKKTRNPLQNAG
ncbi:MAG TPA: excinuclease ABC subunit UvrC [Desulfobacterales bacterium]|nr:excinuclease ABC subunit UvrC [Desulfobacterales bacterium]